MSKSRTDGHIKDIVRASQKGQLEQDTETQKY